MIYEDKTSQALDPTMETIILEKFHKINASHLCNCLKILFYSK